MKRKYLVVLAVVIFLLLVALTALAEPVHTLFLPFLNTENAGSSLGISAVTDNSPSYPGGQIPQYEKLEVTFQVDNTVAGNFQLPYDPNLPAGLDGANPLHNGISVQALFLPPGESNWAHAFRQPAFYYQYFDDQIKKSWDGKDHEWFYPSGAFAWKIRFSPHKSGTWQYKLSAQDAGGSVLTAARSFVVIPSGRNGFVRVSSSDPRYFEFDSGKLFQTLGLNGAGALDDPLLSNQPVYQKYSQNGIHFVRVWISGMYGTSWLEWLGGRNAYDGYLPRPGTEPFHDPIRDQDSLALRIDYEPEGDTGWYDACRFQFWNDPEAVKPNTNYRLQIKYWGQAIRGPRVTGHSQYGLVGKIGGEWEVDCYEPGTSSVVTNYGGSTADWGLIEGVWNSGSNNFLPRIYLGLENVLAGTAFIQSISLREDLGGGQYGPEIINEHSLQHELYIPEQSAYAMDKLITLAEQSGVYLKLVLMEKNDMVYVKLDDDGSFVIGGEADNQDGFYGLGREMNKTRWLQQAWWRYLQARWGYSPNIHSWEATNEGDPWLPQHYALTDELGKFMHCRVFGVEVPEGDGQKCSYAHPNRHLVTTSFWHSFPAEQFWMNPVYPNVDYADLHAYISTSQVGIPSVELEKMQWDAAYYHLGHSQAVSGWELGKPVVRGEAGIDSINQQVEQPGLASDQHGVWLHNLLWSTLDPGAMPELYWWGDQIAAQPGPDGSPGLYEVFGYFNNFLAGIPLNQGGYQDAAATASDSDVRVVGQKNTGQNRAHLWLQYKNHTWKNVVDGAGNLSGLSGTVSLGGFSPNTTLAVQWFVFTTQGIPSLTTGSVTTAADGSLALSLPGGADITDLGLKIGDYPAP